MRLRLFVLFVAGLAVVAATADSQLSFSEVIGRAQRGDNEAYLTMAEGYRYGRNGFEKSLTNARYCYELAGVDVDSLAERACETNREDEFGLMFRLLETMRISGLDRAINDTEKIQLPETDWAQTFNDLASNRNREDFADYVVGKITPDASADECNMALMFLYDIMRDEDNAEPLSAMFSIAAKIPYYYNWIGESALEISAENPTFLVKAIEFFKRANDRGMLLPVNAAKVLKTGDRTVFSAEELEKLKELAAKI